MENQTKPKPNLGHNIVWWLPWWSRMEREDGASRKKINFIQLLSGGNQYKKYDFNNNPDLERVIAKGKKIIINLTQY